ncbi:hypothetical protein QJQ45_016837 [Haematococcus lacustris]|nr:hypothetical protein QJQ45_016837 [Haematococcus lacustris]
MAPLAAVGAGTGFKRATSMLFNVLADEEDTGKAQQALQAVARKVQGPAAAAGQGQLRQSPHVPPGAGPLVPPAEQATEAIVAGSLQSPVPTPALAPSPHPASVTQGSGGLSVDADAAAMAADRACLAEQLQGFTPEVILRELLGSLFVHPSQLTYEGLLGEGAFATVHKASLLPAPDPLAPPDTPPGPALEVAVKQLKPEVLSSHADLKDFLMELNVMRKLQHLNVVHILGIGASQLDSLDSVRRSMYVVQEACGGGTLKHMVVRQMTSRSAVYDHDDALRWMSDIAAALHYLHDVCKPMIIHRDLKLDNILLTGDKRCAKLVDFGLHKRARLNAATGSLYAPTAGAGGVGLAAGQYDERSYYGGTAYANASVHFNASLHAPQLNPSVHHNASLHRANTALALLRKSTSAMALSGSQGRAPGQQGGGGGQGKPGDACTASATASLHNAVAALAALGQAEPQQPLDAPDLTSAYAAVAGVVGEGSQAHPGLQQQRQQQQGGAAGSGGGVQEKLKMPSLKVTAAFRACCMARPCRAAGRAGLGMSET